MLHFLRYLLSGLFILVALLIAFPVQAHANLQHSDPPANASLEQSPPEIRLWFTEPLEANYSQIILIDAQGNQVDLPPSQVDANDAYQMFLVVIDNLPDGIYTVSWRVVSSTDGHPTEGSFSFGIGAVVEAESITMTLDQNTPVDDVWVRWVNLMSFALLVGGIAFTLLVWQPTSGTLSNQPLKRYIRIGWGSVGVASVLMLMLRASIALDTGLFNTLLDSNFVNFLSTDYGKVWIIRMILWGVLGIVLLRKIEHKVFLQISLLVAIGVLLSHSLFSHAGNALDVPIAILADFLHLLATSLWVGGLIAFAMMLLIKHTYELTQVARMVAYFSNYARISVALLIITGIYAMWLQVGSIEALLNTVYGQTLFIKILLFVPLLGIGGVNFIVTQRQLQSGQAIWISRLRGLIGAEITLTIGILIAVAIMTSTVPARTVQVQREAIESLEASNPQDASYFGMEVINDQMFHLEIEPGYVGVNTFIVAPYDANGQAITDASLIRLRFDNLDQSLGQSELRPEFDAELGAYVATGSNLSTPGLWRIRMTIQRPGEYDTVIDFEPQITAVPPQPQLVINDVIPTSHRAIANSLTGIALLGIGGFFLFRTGDFRLFGIGGFAGLAVFSGVVFLFYGAGNFLTNSTLLVEDAWSRPAGEGSTTAVYLEVENNTSRIETLIGAEVTIADRVELHSSQVDANDIARMTPLESISIPAGEHLSIAPNGYHIMLVNLHHDLNEGDTFPMTLRFESGQEITVEVAVGFGNG